MLLNSETLVTERANETKLLARATRLDSIAGGVLRYGIVALRTRGLNQRGETTIEFKRSFMAYKRGAPEVTGTFPEPIEDWRS